MSQLSAKITADVSGYRKSIQDAKNVLKGFTKAESETAETLKKVYDVTNDQVNAYKKVADSMLKATDGTKTIKQASNQLKNDIEKLKIQWANLSETARNSKFGQSMANSIRTAEAQLKSMQSTMPAATKSWTEIGSKLNIAGVNVGDLVGKIKTLNPAMVGVAGAAKIMTDAFMSSETAMDGVRRTMSGLQNTYDTFIRQVRDGSLDISNIFESFRLGKEKYDAEDALGSLIANNKAVYEEIKATVAEARETVAEGGKVNTDDIRESVTKMYADIKAATEETIETSIKSMAGGDSNKESLIRRMIFSDDPNAELAKMQSEMKAVDKLMQDWASRHSQYVQSMTPGMPGFVKWDSNANLKTYKEMEQRLKAIRSVINDETAIQTDIIEKQSQLNALKRDEKAQMTIIANLDRRSLSNANKEIKNQEKTKKAKSVELDEKWLNDDVYEELPAYIAKQNEEFSKLTRTYTFGVDEIISANLAAHASTVEFLSTWDKGKLADGMLNSIGSINSSLSSVYDTMKGIGDLDNPFKVFDALINTATNVKNVVDTMQSLGTMMRTIGAINKAETANAIAMDQAKIASNQAETASSVGAASAETMAAHASIPFAGIAIATAAIGAMIAVLASTKNKVPKFANGGIISGPTLGLMGEYSGAANNPEVVAPLDKLRNLIGDNGTSNANVRFEIEGRTLVGILGKENRLNSRR